MEESLLSATPGPGPQQTIVHPYTSFGNVEQLHVQCHVLRIHNIRMLSARIHEILLFQHFLYADDGDKGHVEIPMDVVQERQREDNVLGKNAGAALKDLQQENIDEGFTLSVR